MKARTIEALNCGRVNVAVRETGLGRQLVAYESDKEGFVETTILATSRAGALSVAGGIQALAHLLAPGAS